MHLLQHLCLCLLLHPIVHSTLYSFIFKLGVELLRRLVDLTIDELELGLVIMLNFVFLDVDYFVIDGLTVVPLLDICRPSRLRV